MRLDRLFISRDIISGELDGNVKFSNQLGSVELKVSDDQCRQILAICAGGLVDVTQKAADEMAASVITPWDKHDKIKS